MSNNDTNLSSIPTTSSSPLILKQSLVGGNVVKGKSIEILFLGCELKAPYGPNEKTATLFLHLFCRALAACSSKTTEVILKVFEVSKGNFPTEQDFDNCDGAILPGSFNSAYDKEPWILKLIQVIQNELFQKQLPTLGVCFGHQIYAHSFEDGMAIKCPDGCQAGRKKCKLTKEGEQWLTNPQGLDLYYTHGDMVAKLPRQAVSLGGNSSVPIQAALYFAHPPNDIGEDENNKPIAVTFQAHPEFASSKELGLEQTFDRIIQTMEERNDISPEERQFAKEDAKSQFENVESHSIKAMVAVGKAFGWF